MNYISKLSFLKVWNLFLIKLSFHLSNLLKRVIVWGRPMAISIEPTTSCNLRCPECPSGLREFTRPTGMMTFETLKKIVDEQKKYLTYITFYFQGEPYLNKQFLEHVNYASKNNIYTATSTNAHYLNDENSKNTIESGLDKLIISIDGTTQETYQQYRVGGDLKKVLEGTKNVLKWKKKLKSSTPHIIFQFLVVQPNEHQIEDAKKLAKEIGVDDIVFKTAQIYDYKNGSKLIPSIDYYSRYKKDEDNSYILKNKLENKCWRMWSSNVITWNGNVIPCCFDKDGEHTFGNILTEKSTKILDNENYQIFRNQLLRDRKQIDICRNCTEGTKVWA